MQGPLYLADDRGKVCSAKDLDYSTGCCTTGQQHYCDMCNKADSCCEVYEHCVSCCMAPENKPEERRKETSKAPNNKQSGFWADTFQYCLAICRTHGRSTSHENAYIGPRHHCFSKLGKPLLSPPLPAGSLDGVTVVLSAAGASCSTMCEQKGLVCSQKHLHLLNSCDRLREVLNCEAGCESEQHTATLPAAVDPEAPKASRPALCLVGKQDTSASAFTCDATENHMRRLCSCVKGPGTAGSPGGSAAGTATGVSQGQRAAGNQKAANSTPEQGGAGSAVAGADSADAHIADKSDAAGNNT
eukprot:GHRR01017856.1.p1 GENE.GHRR01017856.1~~GHRR01017856.1.p1  ORF type:complete len:301 (+),score=83.81 GHRR01017856.1:437-1339(+)